MNENYGLVSGGICGLHSEKMGDVILENTLSTIEPQMVWIFTTTWRKMKQKRPEKKGRIRKYNAKQTRKQTHPRNHSISMKIMQIDFRAWNEKAVFFHSRRNWLWSSSCHTLWLWSFRSSGVLHRYSGS